MKLTKLYHRIFDGVICAIALILYMCACGSDSEEVRPDDTSASVAFRASGTTESAVGSFEGDLMLDFSAPAGTSYTISMTEGGSWCWTSRLHQSTEKTAVMAAAMQSEKIYLAANQSAARTARISVIFSTGESYSLTVHQAAGSSSVSFNRAWAELPVCQTGSNQTIVDHYCTGKDGRKVRNFTMLYDTKECIARWVAYPIHSSYMEAPYVRSNAWAYDPKVPTNQQADLDGRSYQGGYIRGHQCMSNHRYVQASSEMNAQTFYSTNIMPQNSTFNSGLWGSMEQVCTAQACSDTLYCVTGNWGTRGYATDQNGKRIAAPEYCFKVILRTRSGRTGKRIDQITDASQLKAIGYWAANASSSNSGNLRDYTVSVSEIERKTGFKFFPMLEEKIAEQVKAQNNPSDFGIN